jgi:hypothetical protein
MENIHSDASVGLAAALGATAMAVLMAAYVWAGASFVSLASDELSVLARTVTRLQ